MSDIGEFLKKRIDSFEPKPLIYRYGTVKSVADGIVRIDGLPHRSYGELLEFESDVYGMALDLEEEGVGAVLLNTSDNVAVGTSVRGTGRVTEVPVGDELLGRVIDPIGRPLDNHPLSTKNYFTAERPAPPLIKRRPVDTPLETGILAIDSMIPIGRGQRELIIGDRQTGKTSIAIDTIIHQNNTNVICIYCAIGQKASNISQTVKTLTDSGAMEHCVVVAATAGDSPAMQYLAPYSACSVAEYFMEKGKDVLVVYDDLSKHAVAYRTISLLLHRPPGREAYPGDVFYLHSRLLERAACLSKEYGGGSITALPIIETTGGNISAYIPTNVISITDGQIYLESELFHSGIRPAVNTGLSVSRVGRSAQHKAMQKVSGSLRIQLAQYREMAVFARFSSDIDSTTKKMLDNGERLTALFKQGRRQTFDLAQEVIMLGAFSENAFADVKVSDMDKARRELISEISSTHSNLVRRILDTKDLDQETKNELISAVKDFMREKGDK
ncbi:MAG: F0F1 ATP synthase subunit alpha [Clostridia bacterium]|nr:F0F1 ATP synthase subunit alpha [Clostridia bacterium]